MQHIDTEYFLMHVSPRLEARWLWQIALVRNGPLLSEALASDDARTFTVWLRLLTITVGQDTGKNAALLFLGDACLGGSGPLLSLAYRYDTIKLFGQHMHLHTMREHHKCTCQRESPFIVTVTMPPMQAQWRRAHSAGMGQGRQGADAAQGADQRAGHGWGRSLSASAVWASLSPSAPTGAGAAAPAVQAAGWRGGPPGVPARHAGAQRAHAAPAHKGRSSYWPPQGMKMPLLCSLTTADSTPMRSRCPLSSHEVDKTSQRLLLLVSRNACLGSLSDGD